jgi:prevent-host-death family protein
VSRVISAKARNVSSSAVQVISTTEARADFSEIVNRVAYTGERIVLERRGKHVGALVSVEDLELLEKIEDKMDLREARKRLAHPEGRVRWQKVKTDLGL